ncbi:winged helix-turn-helix transcriptional regulator [Pedobacter sp. UBA5917]|jgi:DNA-binding HxlR family transcriptional regulator|uniref:winged helix-turn-helix transcriptional regulator n=1 Tax=Pedobacter sp. UBA5917 TaxID=1947061 RepID=UPI0025DD6EE0|nr:helix-turn-helix domain-containing protein [Pedobacter sp. UBA5917]
MYERKIPLPLDCGLHLTREVLNGKWKPAILNAISLDIVRPSEMVRALSDASKRVLNTQLRELENHGIIGKTIYQQYPSKVEYFLTDLGKSLMPVIDAMNYWGDQNRSILKPLIAADTIVAEPSGSGCQTYQSMVKVHNAAIA